MLKWLLIIVLVGYCGLLLLVYLGQRALQYFPERARTPPAAAGLPEAEEVVLDASDGERVIVWHIPPRGEKPVVLYFHGNGGSLRFRVDRFRALAADGTGLIALSYRGYGGSSGRPTEKGLIDDALTAYAFAAARYPASRWRSRRKSRSGASCWNRLSPRSPTSRLKSTGSFPYDC